MSERRLKNVNDCFNCPRKAKGCRDGCVDMAIRQVLDALCLPERKHIAQLGMDLRALKRQNIIRRAKRDAKRSNK